MDQGVIWLLNSKHRVLSVRCIITALENNKDIQSFSVLDATKMLVLVLENVTKEMIINCFSKASISKDQQKRQLLLIIIMFQSTCTQNQKFESSKTRCST